MKNRLMPLLSFSAIVAMGGAACTVSQMKAAPAAEVSEKDTTAAPAPGATRLGKDALGDWTTDAPGVRRKLTAADLPAPYDTPSARNGPKQVAQPEGAWPKVPQGFTVERVATGLQNPRRIATAPNGDIFIAESGANRVHIVRPGKDGKPEINAVFAEGLRQPFGVGFFPSGANPKYIYVANTDSVVRFPYKNGDIKASGAEEMIVSDVPGGGRLTGGGHWTRDIAFSQDNKRMWVSVGSRSNVDDVDNNPREVRRADILEFTPDGKNEKTFASGVRNAVGIAVQPGTGNLWMSVNERDELGDHLVPDYVSSVKQGGFYGWPWYYIGGNQDPRHKGKHPELKDKVIVPDVLLQSHSASLSLAFYTAGAFPSEYKGDIFAAEHGSWNRARRTGYKVVRIPLKNGKATGEYEDFVTGFVTADGDVWGRPVGVSQGKDGSLFFTDDGTNSLWRVSYTGAKK